MSQRIDNSAPLIVDHGPEVSTVPWPRADDPKQVYLDTSSGIPPSKPENIYASYEQPTHNNPPLRNKIAFGLGLWGWSILLVVVTALIVGGAVGGGVGGALASCNSQTSSLKDEVSSATGNTTTGAPSISVAIATVTVSATSPSSTTVIAPIDLSNYTVASPATVSEIFVDCPNLDDQTYTTTRGDEFTIYCDTDSGFGSPSLEDSDLTLQVFAGFVSYSLKDCLEACSSYNAFSARNGVEEMQCRSITFNHKMSQSVATNGYVNCWIKNGTLAKSDLGRSGDTTSCMLTS